MAYYSIMNHDVLRRDIQTAVKLLLPSKCSLFLLHTMIIFLQNRYAHNSQIVVVVLQSVPNYSIMTVIIIMIFRYFSLGCIRTVRMQKQINARFKKFPPLHDSDTR